MKTQLNNNDLLLFIGDSITDCGRMDLFAPLGNGYVRMFADMLTVREPEKNVQIINRGISGHTIEDLKNRWHEDVILHKPDWLSIKIGINDLHRYYMEENFDHLSPEGFGKIYDGVLSATRDALPECKILLIDPFYLSTDDTTDAWRTEVLSLLSGYIDAVHAMSEKYGTRLVKTHALFQEQLKIQHPDRYCDEPVHPNLAGHLLIAEAVYAALCK